MINSLKIHPVARLFPMLEGEEMQELAENIKSNGLLHPIVIQDGVLLDGRNRLSACKSSGVKPIFQEYDGDPVQFIISTNIHRRHLTESQRGMIAERLADMERGDNQHGACANLHNQKVSRTEAARMLNVSPRTVSTARKIRREDESLAKEVESGKKTIHAANKELTEKKEIWREPVVSEKSKFNRTNDNIEWAHWSWNPVTGCKYNCKYCYARDIAMRFQGNFDPRFIPERLPAPGNTKPDTSCIGGHSVFVCSMADLFGDWVPNDWIFKVMEEVEKNPQWNFIFLTKNPKRYASIRFPSNAWAGATTDTQSRADEAEKWLAKTDAPVRFVSCEPMLEPIKFNDITVLDWVIIGGRSRNSKGPEFQPDIEWVMDLSNKAKQSGLKVYWKPNLRARFTEHPGGESCR